MYELYIEPFAFTGAGSLILLMWPSLHWLIQGTDDLLVDIHSWWKRGKA